MLGAVWTSPYHQKTGEAESSRLWVAKTRRRFGEQPTTGFVVFGPFGFAQGLTISVAVGPIRSATGSKAARSNP